MKRILPPDDSPKFSGNLRHYHRSVVKSPKTWDEWVEGNNAQSRKPKNWLKIFAIILGTLALCGIITGLVIELRLF